MPICSIALGCLLAAPAGAAETESRNEHNAKIGTFDLHYDVRYPGYRRSDVSLDKVTEEKGDLKIYTRRVVEWWPKRRVDVVPLEDIKGAPLRTWTMKKAKSPSDYLDNFPTGVLKTDAGA